MCALQSLIRITIIITIILTACIATDHLVGNSIWSIPLSNDFYDNWAHNVTFLVGDTLVFKFETGLSDVTQVSRQEYKDCTTENPFKTVVVGPGKIRLDEDGMHYYVCSFGNYCKLGQKLAVPVQRPAGA